MRLIEAKTILNRVKYGDGWYGIDYNMNLIDNFDLVRRKENALLILEQELSKNIELNVCVFSKRLKVIKLLSDNGIF